jgi:hypothetical protein
VHAAGAATQSALNAANAAAASLAQADAAAQCVISATEIVETCRMVVQEAVAFALRRRHGDIAVTASIRMQVCIASHETHECVPAGMLAQEYASTHT